MVKTERMAEKYTTVSARRLMCWGKSSWRKGKVLWLDLELVTAKHESTKLLPMNEMMNVPTTRPVKSWSE